eukprot:6295306-Prymnesium_polylepis.2
MEPPGSYTPGPGTCSTAQRLLGSSVRGVEEAKTEEAGSARSGRPVCFDSGDDVYCPGPGTNVPLPRKRDEREPKDCERRTRRALIEIEPISCLSGTSYAPGPGVCVAPHRCCDSAIRCDDDEKAAEGSGGLIFSRRDDTAGASAPTSKWAAPSRTRCPSACAPASTGSCPGRACRCRATGSAATSFQSRVMHGRCAGGSPRSRRRAPADTRWAAASALDAPRRPRTAACALSASPSRRPSAASCACSARVRRPRV